MKQRWLVLDTETTGLLKPSSAPLEAQPKIIELAVAEIWQGINGDLTLGLKATWLVNPGEPLSAEITKITGLKDEDLKGAPPFQEVLKMAMPWFLGTFGMVAHNLPFDLGMLVNELRRLGKENAFPYPPRQVCTVAAFQPEWGRRPRLIELYERKLGRPLAQTHRALDDVMALVEIVLKEPGVLA